MDTAASIEEHEAPPITVAVVSWNTRVLLARCLESLHQSASGGLTEVWVVDNASNDGSAQLVRERFPWVKLIASDRNLGYGAAVNLVARQTDSEWIVAANADVAAQPGALAQLLAEGRAHPRCGVIAPRLILPGGATQHSVYPFPSVTFALAYASGAIARSRHLAHHWCIDQGFDPDEPREVPWAVGAFLFVRRTAWRQVAGFDEAQWMYAEDLDLGWRLQRAGWSARYLPDARVHHEESAATQQAWGPTRHARWHASTYAWMARRRGFAATRTVATIYVASYLARALRATLTHRLGDRDARQVRAQALGAARVHAIGLRTRAEIERVR